MGLRRKGAAHVKICDLNLLLPGPIFSALQRLQSNTPHVVDTKLYCNIETSRIHAMRRVVSPRTIPTSWFHDAKHLERRAPTVVTIAHRESSEADNYLKL